MCRRTSWPRPCALRSCAPIPKLSRFDPLPRIISHDSFSQRPLRLVAARRQLRERPRHDAAGLRSAHERNALDAAALGFRLAWRHGIVLALKIATRPRKGAQNVAIKRHTFRHRGTIRFEVVFHLQAARRRNSSSAKPTCVRSDSCSICSRAIRTRRGARDAASALPQRAGRQHVQKWQFKRRTTEMKPIGDSDKTISHYHLAPRRLGGHARTARKGCATTRSHQDKLDLSARSTSISAEMKALAFRATTARSTCRPSSSIRMPAMKNLWCMLNFCFFAETRRRTSAPFSMSTRSAFRGTSDAAREHHAVVGRNRALGGRGRDGTLRSRLGARGGDLRAGAEGAGRPGADGAGWKSRPTGCTGCRRAHACQCRPRRTASELHG